MKVIIPPDAVARPAESLESFLGKLQRVQSKTGYWIARCPAHDDRVQSLSISHGKKQPVVWKCHAGCSQDAVAQAMGFERASSVLGSQPYREEQPEIPHNERRVVAVYPYVDENGEVLNEVVRFEPKGFGQRRPRRPEDTPEYLRELGLALTQYDESYVYSLKGTERRVLYRLPDLLGSRDGVTYFVEGEKDADALRALGCRATTSLGGASSWRSSLAEPLRGHDVVILPDNDEPGRAYAAALVDGLRGIAASVRVVALPGLPDKGDVSDYLAAGATREELEELVAQAPYLYRRSRCWTAKELAEAGNLPKLEGFLADYLVARGDILLIAGRRGIGKTFITLTLAARIAQGLNFGPYRTKQGRVLYVSQEMGESAIQRRLRKLFSSAELASLGDRLRIVCKEPGVDLSTPEGADVLIGLIDDARADVVIIDALRDVIGHASEKENDEMRPVMVNLRDRVAAGTNTAVILIHHIGKLNADGGHSGGRGASVIEDVPSDVMYLEREKGTDRRVAVLDKTRDMEPQSSFAFDMFTDEETGRLVVDVQSEAAVAGELDDLKRAKELVVDARELPLTELAEQMGWTLEQGRRKLMLMEKTGMVKKERRADRRLWAFVERRQGALEEVA